MKLIALAVMSVVSAQAVSENVIRVSAPVHRASSATWRAAAPIVSEWDVLSTTCAEWAPKADTVDDDVSFTQTRACNKDESRTTQQREYNAQLDQYRNVGSPATESRTVSEVESQDAVGAKQVYSTLKIINPIQRSEHYFRQGKLPPTLKRGWQRSPLLEVLARGRKMHP